VIFRPASARRGGAFQLLATHEHEGGGTVTGGAAHRQRVGPGDDLGVHDLLEAERLAVLRIGSPQSSRALDGDLGELLEPTPSLLLAYSMPISAKTPGMPPVPRMPSVIIRMLPARRPSSASRWPRGQPARQPGPVPIHNVTNAWRHRRHGGRVPTRDQGRHRTWASPGFREMGKAACSVAASAELAARAASEKQKKVFEPGNMR